MLRLFVAVDVPDDVRREIAALCTQVNHARWVKPHQLHITLRFMGKTPDQDLDGICRKLASVRSSAFDLSLRGAGTFPTIPSSPSSTNSKRARVLWLGLDPKEPLAELKRDIDARLGPDTERPGQGFSPHLTLARFTEKTDATLPQFVSRHGDYRGKHWRVDCFRLYRSTLDPGGAVHEVVETYDLD